MLVSYDSRRPVISGFCTVLLRCYESISLFYKSIICSSAPLLRDEHIDALLGPYRYDIRCSLKTEIIPPLSLVNVSKLNGWMHGDDTDTPCVQLTMLLTGLFHYPHQ